MRFKLLGSIPLFFAQSALAWAQWTAAPVPGAVPPPIPMEGFGGFLQTQQAQRAASIPVEGFGGFLPTPMQQPMPASVPGRASTMPAAAVLPAASALPAPPLAPSLERTTQAAPPVVSESKKVAPVPTECPADDCCDNACVKECYFTKKKKHSSKPCPPADGCEATKQCESPCANPCPKECCEPKKKPDLCKPCGHFWASADYLLWWINNSPSAVPLLVTGPASGNGIVGAPGTTALPQNGLGFGPFSGAQVAAGISPVGQPDFAAEFGFLWLFQQSSQTSLASDAAGNPLIALPFTDATGAPDRLLLAFPGVFAGNATVAGTSQLWGGEANLAGHLLGRTWLNLDGIVGFRYLDLQETLNVNAFSIDLTGTGTFNGVLLPLGTPVFLNDSFRTDNNFYGGQIGFRVEARRGPVYALLTSKVAFGVNQMAVHIAGSSQAGALTANGGLFALPTNIGAYRDDTFAVIPEVNLTLGYQFGRNWRTYVGYSMLYWNRVARPGDQISGVINPAQVPLSGVGTGLVGPALPAFSLQHSDFWAHGLNFGVAYHF